jgi:hypothetical protein
MPRIAVPAELNVDADPHVGGGEQKKVLLTQTNWHAQWPGGAAINAVTPANFTNPDTTTYCDRVPELALAGGGTPGTYAITGTWDGKAQSDSITTVAGSTVKGKVPFDTITSVVGPDPAAALDLYHGDSYCDPPCRCLQVGGAGDIDAQLSRESTLATTHPYTRTRDSIPAGDWQRRVRRIGRDNTTATDLEAVW